MRGGVMSNVEKLREARALITEVIQDLEEDPIPPPDDIPAHELVFKNGNLWKPQGDHTGKLVVLLRADWPQPAYVDVRARDGAWERMMFTGRSNGDRHTYRGNFPGGPHYAGKNRQGGVRMLLNDRQYMIPIPGRPKNRHE
jgi:hypothetical protein